MGNLKGGRCLFVLAFVLLGMFIVLFGVSVIFNQQQPGAQQGLPTVHVLSTSVPATPNDTSGSVTIQAPGAQPDQPTVQAFSSSGHAGANDTSGNFGVTIQAPDASTVPTSTQINTPVPTVTPGQLGLGTPSFPLTLTAQHADDQTKVAGRLSEIDATATAIGQQSQIIFATLTAAAPKKK